MTTAKVVRYPIDKLRQDLIDGCWQEHRMSVPAFIKAIQSGALDKYQYGNRELWGLSRTLPGDDPVFMEQTVAHVFPPRSKITYG